MVKILCVILAVILVIGILGTIGYIGVKTVGYMINQNFNFSMAWDWAWADYGEFIQNLLGQAHAENYLVFPMTNQHIDVVACTAL